LIERSNRLDDFQARNARSPVHLEATTKDNPRFKIEVASISQKKKGGAMSLLPSPSSSSSQSLTTPLDLLAIAAINGYQRYLSPRKGFVCAHRVLLGGESCSEFIKQLTRTEGIWAALRSLRPRFQACRAAAKALRAARQAGDVSTNAVNKELLEEEPGSPPLAEAEQDRPSRREPSSWVGWLGCFACVGGLDGCSEPQAPDCDPGCDPGGCA
jgi:putative component of membrane protein insertase Oxa1/YidC/SpoIIIJ protein YidD